MPNFKDYDSTTTALRQAQDADHDNRQRARDAHLFVNKPDGQWEPFFWNLNSGRPRYSFDMTTPVIDQISGELDQSDFVIKVDPAGGEASKDLAKTADGLIRNIQNISNAKHIYNAAARAMITGGIDGWRVSTKFVDDNAFDQDIVIEKISNFSDRVWFDPGAEKQDASDATYVFVLQGLTRDAYEKRFPKGSGMSVSEDRQANAYWQRADIVVVGEVLFIRERDTEIVMLSSGQVFEVNDEYRQVADDLAALGLTELKRRKRKKKVVFSRMFDGSDWLEKEKETVFSWLPVIPTYGNFSVFENKVTYWGVVDKLADYQRVFNYAKSREIEEVALSPRAKWWMTPKQAAGHNETLRTLNTNADPIQMFNPDSEMPGAPQQNGGGAVNPGLVTMSQSMQDGIARAAGLFAASMGEQVNNQSGVAIKALQDKGNIGTVKYFSAQEVAICHTGRIIMDAIPSIYDTERQLRVLGEDGTTSMVTVNQSVPDAQTGETVQLIDLSKGLYDVTCSAGPAFQSRQEETVSAIIEMAQVDPTIIEMGGDILFRNVSAPGMPQLAERKRAQLLQAGMIPESQLTDDEKAAIQAAQEAAAQQPEQPDPASMIAQAELLKAQVLQQEAEIATQEKGANLQLKEQEQGRKTAETEARIENQQDQIDINAQKAETEAQKAETAQLIAVLQQQSQEQQTASQAITQILENQKIMAETMKIIREAQGVDVITGPHATEAFVNTAVGLTESQERAGVDTSIGEEVTGQ